MTYKLINYEDLKAFSGGLKTKYATKNDLPKNLSDLQEDTTHRVVTDAEKMAIKSSINKVEKSYDEKNRIVFTFTNNDGITQSLSLPIANARRSGLMSQADRKKLTNIVEGANKIVKLSELENDKTFKTESEIQSMIEKASSLKKEVVTSLPQTGKDDVIYLVKDPKGKDNNNYLEYLWLNGKYELIGSTQVDLSGYVTNAELNNSVSIMNESLTSKIKIIEQSTHNTLDKDKDKAIVGDNGTNILDDKTYTTPEYVNWLISLITTEQFKMFEEVLKTLSDEKLDKTDIQEFTQQELEEAFK